MELTTERLILRDFREDDLPAMLAYHEDPRFHRYYADQYCTPEWVRELHGWFMGHQQTDPRFKFQLAVILRETGELIGNCGIRKDDVDSHQASIGYEYDPNQWGKGYATEAAREIVRFGFEGLGVHKLWAHCIAENVGSVRVLEKVGMQLEGRLRHDEYFRDRYWDSLRWGMLRDEWEAHIRE